MIYFKIIIFSTIIVNKDLNIVTALKVNPLPLGIRGLQRIGPLYPNVCHKTLSFEAWTYNGTLDLTVVAVKA